MQIKGRGFLPSKVVGMVPAFELRLAPITKTLKHQSIQRVKIPFPNPGSHSASFFVPRGLLTMQRQEAIRQMKV